MSRDVVLLLAARALRAFSYGAVGLVMILYLARIGFDATSIGLLLTLSLVGNTLVSLVLTTRADAWGRRRVLFASALLMAGASLVFAATDNFLLLVVAATIGVISPTGGEVGSFLSVEQASLSQIVSDRQRTPAFGGYQVVGSFSSAAGSLLAGLIVSFLESAGFDSLVGYRVVLGTTLLIGILLAGLFLVVSPGVEVASPSRPAGRLGLHQSRGIVARLAALFAVDSFASGLIQMALILYWVHLRYGVEEAGLGFIWFWFQLFTAVSAMASVWTARRIGLINTMVFTHIPASIMLMLIPFMPTLELTVGLILVRALITQMDVPVRQSYTMAVVEPDERSAAAGITNVVRSLASAIGPGISTPLIVVPGLWVIPFLAGGTLKIAYDLTLWKVFSSRPAPEERQQVAAPRRSSRDRGP
jgi:MFS family permease